MDKYVYPAIFRPDKNTGKYTVEFPDVKYCTAEGGNLEAAIYEARVKLGIFLFVREKYHLAMPAASEPLTLKKPADALVIAIDVEMMPFRRVLDTRSVKRFVSIPKWLIEWAEANNIDFSRILQEALEVELGVADGQSHALERLNELAGRNMFFKYVFPGFFERIKEKYTAVLPDFPHIKADGVHLNSALYWARRALAKHVSGLQAENMPIPVASDPATLVKPEKAMIIQVKIDLLENRESLRQIIYLPGWLDDLAKARNINLAEILMKALRGELGCGTDRCVLP